ncbi:YraN family protein [Shewanella mesophila]|uniref:YraN family protein n=1 Tax=Shewanella mesophila TaxID=2864208 RepID=UPI001C65FCCF|nr:YraN family protein [Shewanella mesophila]QYJ86393.1 YraN family protein [Shewanella mesophila]
MTQPKHLTQGQQAEDNALAYLEQQGLKLVERNVRYPFGEIDLIMMQGQKWIFIEVKYRQSKQFGGAIQAISRGKIDRLRRAASHYMQRHNIDAQCRFDVVAIDASEINWITDAF